MNYVQMGIDLSKQEVSESARSKRDNARMLDSMRICMIGLRGIPNVQGGVETHVEQLVSNLVELGADVHVFARKNYVADSKPYVWRGITVHPLWAPRSTRLEAIFHTALALVKARFLHPDIVHIHAVGPSLVAPLARILGLRVVFTHHGYDYDREKWNSLEKRILQLGEWAGMRFSHARIAIAKHIADRMQKDFKAPVHFIPNGVKVDTTNPEDSVLSEFGLKKGRYILLVARLVAEKRQLDLIEAFAKTSLGDTKLVLVGGGDADSDYATTVQARAKAIPGVVLTGVQSGRKLASFFSNAGLFVLPSSHEGDGTRTAGVGERYRGKSWPVVGQIVLLPARQYRGTLRASAGGDGGRDFSSYVPSARGQNNVEVRLADHRLENCGNLQIHLRSKPTANL
jgi:glycosyltransferase involved in cell wall biosynthesis